MLKFRSVSSIVIAPASTGSAKRSKIAVIITDHTNKGVFSKFILGHRMFMMVLIKLIAPSSEDTPARWSEKITRSTEGPVWNAAELKGGYTVHPVPAPPSIIVLRSSNISEDIKNQNLKLFIRGNDMSGAPIINGTSQLPNPPIKMGITMKKIIMNACPVTIEL